MSATYFLLLLLFYGVFLRRAGSMILHCILYVKRCIIDVCWIKEHMNKEYKNHRMIRLLNNMLKERGGAPGWLSWLSVRLRLRSWSHGLWVRDLRRALCLQLRAWSLLRILSLSLSLSLPHSRSISFSVSKKLKKKKKKERRDNKAINGPWTP